MSIFHEVSVLHQAVLEARPDLTAQLSIHLQALTEVTHPHTGKMIYLTQIQHAYCRTSTQCMMSDSCQNSMLIVM